MEKFCIKCNKFILPESKSRKFCSFQCSRKYHNYRRSKHIYLNKLCHTCNKQFITNKPHKIYCSNDCYKIGARKLRISQPDYYKIKEEKICPVCNIKFIAKRSDTNLCSRKCIDKQRNDKKPRITSKSYFKAHKLKLQHIPQEQLEIIYGTLLGDGSLIKQTDNFHRLSICHSEKQLEYIKFKLSKLSSIFLQQNPNRNEHKPYFFNGRYINTKIQYSIHSISHPNLTNLYGLYYKNKKKIIHRKILNLLTPTSLLIWHLDDGHLSVKGRRIILSTNCFSLSEVKSIKYWFWQKYQIYTTIYSTTQYPVLAFSVDDTKKLIDIFKTSQLFNEIPKSMLYKITIRSY